MHVIYEDNHLIAVCKAAGEIVQGDKTGDTPLSDRNTMPNQGRCSLVLLTVWTAP